MNNTIENKEMKIKVAPEKEGPNKVLNSKCNDIKTLFHTIIWRLGINQYIIGINNKPIKDLIQFNDKLKILEEGSNTENKLVIIFNLLN